MSFSRVFTPVFALAFGALILGACDLGGVTAPSPSGTPPTGNPMDGTQRVTRGLQALYKFNETPGSTIIRDVSAVGTAANLTIAENPAAIQWLPGGGIEITAPARIMSMAPVNKLMQACSASNEITLEAWVEPFAVNQNGPALVMTYSNNINQTNFSMGQSQGLAEVRVRTSDTDDAATPGALSALEAFGNGAEIHLVYTRSGLDDQGKFYIDGQSAGTTSLAGTTDVWGTDYMLTIGNDTADAHSWRGKIYLVAMYCSSLTELEVFQNYSAGR